MFLYKRSGGLDYIYSKVTGVVNGIIGNTSFGKIIEPDAAQISF